MYIVFTMISLPSVNFINQRSKSALVERGILRENSSDGMQFVSLRFCTATAVSSGLLYTVFHRRKNRRTSGFMTSQTRKSRINPRVTQSLQQFKSCEYAHRLLCSSATAYVICLYSEIIRVWTGHAVSCPWVIHYH